MSGYWDAVVAAALGLPGTARPERPPAFAVEDDLLPVEMEDIADLSPPQADIAVQRGAPTPAHETRDDGAAAPEPTVAAETPVLPVESAAGDGLEIERAPAERPGEDRMADSRIDPPRPLEMPDSSQAAASLPSVGEPIAERSLELATDAPQASEAVPALPELPVVSSEQAEPAASARAPDVQVTIAAEPVPASLSDEHDEPADAEPAPLVIEIGRIDIRLLAPEQPAVAPARRAEPFPSNVPSLADYLARRSEAG
jgi:hypothetical protein